MTEPAPQDGPGDAADPTPQPVGSSEDVAGDVADAGADAAAPEPEPVPPQAHRDLAHGRPEPVPADERAHDRSEAAPQPARGDAIQTQTEGEAPLEPSRATPQDRAILDPTAWGAEQARALTRRRDQLRPGGGPELRAPARVIAFANQKGGVGKTTTVISLGAAMTEQGSRVLLVDMDPQGSLGVGLGLEPHQLQTTIYNLLMQDGSHPDDVIVESGIPGLHVLPANIDLAAAELALVQEVAREQALRRVIDRVRYRYDFILIDCPPSLGLLTVNGLTAADGVIVPLECEYFALRGMSLLMDTIDKVRNRLNPELALEGIVATIFDGRTIHAREVLDRVRDAFGDVVFKTTINKTIRFAEAPVVGEPILTYAPRSKGSDAYRDLAREVLSRESSS